MSQDAEGRDLILTLVELATSDGELGNIGAGPLEDMLPGSLRWAEDRAALDPRFAIAFATDSITERRGGNPCRIDSSLTAVRTNLDERRRTVDRAVGVDLYSRRTPANDYEHSFGGSKTAEGNLVRVRLPLSAPRFLILFL
jgi:hypothetical protein